MSGVVSGQLNNFNVKKWWSQGFTCYALILQLDKQMLTDMLVNYISYIEILFRRSYMTFTVNLKGFYQMLRLYCSSSLSSWLPLQSDGSTGVETLTQSGSQNSVWRSGRLWQLPYPKCWGELGGNNYPERGKVIWLIYIHYESNYNNYI